MLPADSLADRVGALTRPFKGTVALYAKNLRTGREFALGADTKVRTASTIKLPILCALESLVAPGRVKWDERIVLRPEDKVTGSGVLGSLEDGTDLTVRNLAILMIIVSDNTATNLITDRITADAVNDYLDAIGLTATRSNRKVRGDGSHAGGAERLEPGRHARGEQEVRPRRVHAARDGAAARDARGRERSSAPPHRRTSSTSSPSSRCVTASRATRRRTCASSSKSGALDALRSDVGIVYTKGGPVAMAITVDDMPVTDYSPDNVGNMLIWQLALGARRTSWALPDGPVAHSAPR